MTTLREAAEDYEETYDLLVRRSELRATGTVVRELRHRAAMVARDRLDRKDDAIELYEALFEDDPLDTVAATALRELLVETGRVDDLGRLLERLIDLGETSDQRCKLRVELAELYDQQELHDSAIDLLRAALDEQPGHGDAVVALSQLYEKTHREEELADLLTAQIAAAVERVDVDAELRFQVRLGEVYESRLGDSQRAIETYQSVLARQSKHRGALEALVRLFQAEDNHAEAAQALERLLDLASGAEASQLAHTLADAYERLEDPDRAVRALERALSVDEANPELRKRLRSFYESQHAWHKLAGIIAGDAGFTEDTRERVALLRQAAEIHSQRRGDHGTAAELLEKASALVPDDRDVLMQLCDAYSESGRGPAAAEVLEKIVQSYGSKRSRELGDIHRRLANAYLAQGGTARAIAELDKAFRIEPGNVQVLAKLGTVALEANDLRKAQQMFRALLLQRLDASSPITKAEVFMNLGEVHARLGENAKAVQMFERALQTDPSLTHAQERLAQLKG